MQDCFICTRRKNPNIIEHCKTGGLAAVVENGYITICKGTWKIRVEKVVNIPLTFAGRAVFNILNILPAVLAAYLRDVKIEDLKLALDTFIPGTVQTPGRMNLFKFKNFEVLIDYAHNTAGFNAISRFLEKVDATPKIGVIAGVGDRRDEDIISLGKVAAGMFDEIIIRQDKNLRHRTEQQIIDLMVQGITEVRPDMKYTVFRKETEAIDFAMKTAVKDSFLVICSDVVPEALDLVKKYKEDEDKFEL